MSTVNWGNSDTMQICIYVHVFLREAKMSYYIQKLEIVMLMSGR